MYCFPSSSIQPIENVQKLDFPLIFKPYICAICCCDDMVIILVNYNIDVGGNTHLLWNPSTRESIVLPSPELPPKEDSCWDWVMTQLLVTIRSLNSH